MGFNKKAKKFYDRKLLRFFLVGVKGFEPSTPWSQTMCATGLRHTPKYSPIIMYNIKKDKRIEKFYLE